MQKLGSVASPQMVDSSFKGRRSVSHRLVWVGLIGLALTVLAVFVIGYWVFVRYERKVLRHLPTNTLAALRVDVEQVALYEPIRKHVFPVIDGAAERGDEGTGRLQRFRELSGVNMGMDLREVAIAVEPRGWVVLVGGLFPESGLVDALAQVVRETLPDVVCHRREQQLDCDPALTIAQSSDGVVILGANPAVVDSALSTSDWAQRNGMSEASAISLVALPQAESARSMVTAGAYFLGATWLGQVTRMVGIVTLGQPLPVQLALDGLPEAAAQDVNQTLERVQAMAALAPGPDWAGERALLARASVRVENGRPVIEAEWTHDELDRAAATVASWLSERLRSN